MSLRIILPAVVQCTSIYIDLYELAEAIGVGRGMYGRLYISVWAVEKAMNFTTYMYSVFLTEF